MLPLAGYVLGLGVRGTIVLATVCSWMFCIVILLYFRRLLPNDPVAVLLLAIGLGSSYIGQWGAVEPFFLMAPPTCLWRLRPTPKIRYALD
jgi:hypothetical protein